MQAVARTLLPPLPRAKVITEKVLVAPARNVWQVTRGVDGRIVGCWVTVPARYAVRHRRVLEWPARTAQTASAAIVTRTRSVVLDPGGAAWEPIAARVKR